MNKYFRKLGVSKFPNKFENYNYISNPFKDEKERKDLKVKTIRGNKEIIHI